VTIRRNERLETKYVVSTNDGLNKLNGVILTLFNHVVSSTEIV